MDKELLLKQHKKAGWGILLIFRDEFFDFIKDSKRHLDIGANVNFLNKTIREKQPYTETIGIDIINYGVKDKHDYIIADANYLPFRNDVFDSISLIETLEHIDNPFRVMSEIYRVLKRNGKVYIQSVHKNDIAYKDDPTHQYPLDHESLLEILNEGKFNFKIDLRQATYIIKMVKK